LRFARFGKLALLPAVLLLLFLSYTTRFSVSSPEHVAPAALTASVKSGQVEEVVLALGTMEPLSTVKVGAQVTGQIKAIHVREGELVTIGDLLAEIDAIPQQNALRIAQARVSDVTAQKEVKRIQIIQAKSNYDRQRKLIGKSAISETDLEEAKARYDTFAQELLSLDAQLIQSKVDLETANANVAYTRIVAPVSGTIVALPAQQGQTLNSSQTSPVIAVIANMSEMSVKVRISEADVWRVRPGMDAEFSIIGEPRIRYSAPLEAVSSVPHSTGDYSMSSLEPGARDKDGPIFYDGTLKVKNAARKFRAKMTVQVYIKIGHAENALIVPWTSLAMQNRDGTYFVKLKMDDGSFTERSVQVGYTDKSNAEILKGLKLDDVVLVNPPATEAGN
jgi:macrolide-specific efflux system membrane fusion protein